ncbi:MAG: CvpA family protein [Sphingomonadaceae bacterium]
MNVAAITWLDAVAVLMLIGSIAFGFHQGLVRQTLLLVAAYIATVLAAQYYDRPAEMIVRQFPGFVPEIARVVAFLGLAIALTILVTWLIWSAYRYTKLPEIVVLDQFGGALLGGIIGLAAIGIALSLSHYALEAPWPAGSPIQQALHVGLLNSSLDGLFSSALPLIQTTLRPWLPSGIPLMLSNG